MHFIIGGAWYISFETSCAKKSLDLLEKVEKVALGINLMGIVQCSFHVV
jgi:hypothetical protein